MQMAEDIRNNVNYAEAHESALKARVEIFDAASGYMQAIVLGGMIRDNLRAQKISCLKGAHYSMRPLRTYI
jgi:hypothetical protein